jgi:dihydropteroate synthase
MNNFIHSNDPSEPILMGIVNVTPDSFSGDGVMDVDRAIEHGIKLIEEGAKILDIGGESTRPGSVPVSSEDEIRRVVPVIEGLRGAGALISIDTRNALTMKAALQAGANFINDVSALEGDEKSLSVAADSNAIVCLMHMKGDPRTMQDAPEYENVVSEVYEYLARRIDACLKAGISKDRVMIDPGIGFGKSLDHNVNLLKNIDKFEGLGVPLLLGVSRKRFIAGLSKGEDPDARMSGSIATALAAYQKGVRYFRVHDVAETAQALSVFRAVF